MEYYSQKDPKWSTERLGYCRTNIKTNGCYLTCLAMLSDTEPPELNRRFKVAGVYTNGCDIISQRAAKELKTFYSKTTSNPKRDYPIIAETNHYAKVGFRSHFFILLPDGKRVDPLDLKPKPEYNNYNIVSYRDFHISEQKKTMNKKLSKAIKNYLYNFGNRLNDSEAEKVAKEIKKLYNERNDLRTELINEQQKPRISYKKEYDDMKSQVVFLSSKLNEINNEYSKEILELQDKVARQAKEITNLKAINTKNAKEAGFWRTFVFLIKTAVNK